MQALRTFASFLWPVLSYLVIIPLYVVAKGLFGARVAMLSCVIYVFIPSVTLITLHTDQVFFPVFFMLPLALAMVAVKRKRWWVCALCGVSVYLALYFTFAMALIFPLLADVVLTQVLRGDGNLAVRRQTVIRFGIYFTVGFLCIWALFSFALNYDPIYLYRHATAHHQNWRGWEGTAKSTAYWGVLNGAEYILWLGVPFALAFCASCACSFKRIKARKPDRRVLINAGLLVIFILLLFFGKTKGEVARLWLFLVPALSMSVAYELNSTYRKPRFCLPAFLVMQWVTIFVTKCWQDFY